MAEILSSFYDKAIALGGERAKLKLALLTNIPSYCAAKQPDSPENIQLFERAYKQVEDEFTEVLSS